MKKHFNEYNVLKEEATCRWKTGLPIFEIFPFYHICKPVEDDFVIKDYLLSIYGLFDHPMLRPWGV